MRAPSVVPRYAVAVGSLKVCRGGTAIGKTPEERGNFIRVRDSYFCKERERGTLKMKVRCRSYLFLLNYGKSRQIDA